MTMPYSPAIVEEEESQQPVTVEEPEEVGDPTQILRDMLCDSCNDFYYDNYNSLDPASKVFLAQELGSELEDHICDRSEEPEIHCTCTCLAINRI